jgi:hypothetical protein
MKMSHFEASTMGASIFTRSAVTEVEEPSNYDRIQREIRHLKNRGMSPWTTNPFMKMGRLAMGFLAVLLAFMYFYDPFAYAYHKTQAMQAYLYLQRWGDNLEVERLEQSGYFSPEDIRLLNGSQANPKEYFVNTAEAHAASYAALRYRQQAEAVRDGDLSSGSVLDYWRYNLLIRWGILPPRQWRALNPSPRTL